MPLVLASLATALAIAALWALAWRISRGVLEPEPYGLRAETAVLDFDAARGVVRLPVPPPKPRQYARTDAAGRYGLLWALDPEPADGALGHGTLGPVTERGPGWLERPLTVVVGPPPVRGAPARLDLALHRRDPRQDLGIAFDDVTLHGPVGAVAAWWIDRGTTDAVVLLHGRRRGRRIETLRVLPSVLAHGASVLVASYRNHDACDPAPSGLYTYGQDEADDLLAAVAFLRARGVERVAAVTFSMGSAVALMARRRWPAEGPRLAGLVLDSPLVDMREVVRARALREGVPLPAPVVDLALALAAQRARIDWRALDLRRHAAGLDLPVLVIGAARDSTVPIALVERLAAALPPAWAEYWRVDDAEHVEAFNVAPEEYEQRVTGLLARAFGSEPRFSAPRSA